MGIAQLTFCQDATSQERFVKKCIILHVIQRMYISTQSLRRSFVACLKLQYCMQQVVVPVVKVGQRLWQKKTVQVLETAIVQLTPLMRCVKNHGKVSNNLKITEQLK